MNTHTISARRILLGVFVGSLLLAFATIAAAQASIPLPITSDVFPGYEQPLFSSTLPAETEGKTDLWVTKLDPCPSDPAGAVYMIQRRFLPTYARGRANGYPWTWAPLSEVLRRLDQPATPAPVRDQTEELARYRAAIAKALESLSTVSP